MAVPRAGYATDFDRPFNGDTHRSDLDRRSAVADVLGVFAVHRLRKGALSSFILPCVARIRSIGSLLHRNSALSANGRATLSTRDTVIEFSWPVITGAIDTNLYAGDVCPTTVP